MSDNVTVKLTKPFDLDGKTYSELTFKEATAGDACRADSVTGEFTKILAILSGMAGVNIPVIQAVAMSDFNALIEKVRPLMGEPLEAPAGAK